MQANFPRSLAFKFNITKKYYNYKVENLKYYKNINMHFKFQDCIHSFYLDISFSPIHLGKTHIKKVVF